MGGVPDMVDPDRSPNYGLKADLSKEIFYLISLILGSVSFGWISDWQNGFLTGVIGAIIFWWWHKRTESEKEEKEREYKSTSEKQEVQFQQEWATSTSFSSLLLAKQKNEIQNLNLSLKYKQKLESYIDLLGEKKRIAFDKEMRLREKELANKKNHLEEELAKHNEEIGSQTRESLLDKFTNELDETVLSLDKFDDKTIELKLRELKNKQLAEADKQFRRPIRGGESLFHSETKNEIIIMADKAEAKLKFKPERYFAKTDNVYLEVKGMNLNPAALGSPDFVDFGVSVNDEFFAVECFPLENSESDEDLTQTIMARFSDYGPVITEIIRENGHRFFLIKFENIKE